MSSRFERDVSSFSTRAPTSNKEFDDCSEEQLKRGQEQDSNVSLVTGSGCGLDDIVFWSGSKPECTYWVCGGLEYKRKI